MELFGRDAITSSPFWLLFHSLFVSYIVDPVTHSMLSASFSPAAKYLSSQAVNASVSPAGGRSCYQLQSPKPQLSQVTYSQSQRLQVELDLVVVLLVVSEEAHGRRYRCRVLVVIRAMLVSARASRGSCADLTRRGAIHNQQR